MGENTKYLIQICVIAITNRFSIRTSFKNAINGFLSNDVILKNRKLNNKLIILQKNNSMFLNSDYWNKRYVNDDFGWDIGEISEPLKQYFNQLTNKELKILIPGAGNAYEAEYLINQEFKQVYVLDFAKQALDNIKQRVPQIHKQQLIEQDFFEHQGSYDLIIEQTFFCAIHPTLRKNYVNQMHQLLKPNGKLVGLLFNDVLNTDKPPFGGSIEEYHALFSEKFHIKKMELCYNSIKPRENRELFINLQKINVN